ncbi:hypothetical protein [Salimicrobium humidisoli]|nr:hypothetical protein [Salimicrobium humidisoli]
MLFGGAKGMILQLSLPSEAFIVVEGHDSDGFLTFGRMKSF